MPADLNASKSALIIIILVSLYGTTASKWLRLWLRLTYGSSAVNLSVSQTVTAYWLIPANSLNSHFLCVDCSRRGCCIRLRSPRLAADNVRVQKNFLFP